METLRKLWQYGTKNVEKAITTDIEAEVQWVGNGKYLLLTNGELGGSVAFNIWSNKWTKRKSGRAQTTRQTIQSL